jgi:hypothetical protein
MGLLTGHCHLKGHSSNAELNRICHLLALLGAHHILHVSRIRVRMALVHSPRCERRKVSEMASHAVTGALAVLGFRHPCHRFLKISTSKVLHFFQSQELLNA